jgi:transcriptional regulator with XRE-family HTH domain
MNGKELRGIRRRLGLSGRQLGEIIGVTQNTIARWERGEVSIGQPAARLIRIIAGEDVPEIRLETKPKARRTKAK